MGQSDQMALRIALGDGQFDVNAANRQLAKKRKPIPTLLPQSPIAGGGKPQIDLANPLGMPLGVERDPYARPLGEDMLSDVTDFIGGATFMDGLGPEASTASTLGLAATAGLSPGMLARQGRGLYSRLVEGLRKNLPAKMKAESVMNAARKTGAKDEELVWAKLEEFLGPRKGTQVSREEVLAHVDANTPKVEAKVLGEVDPDHQRAVAELDALHERRQRYQDAMLGRPIDRRRQAEAPPWEAADESRYQQLKTQMRESDGGPAETKFRRHTLPGGENYRETLITVPDATTALPPQPKHTPSYGWRLRPVGPEGARQFEVSAQEGMTGPYKVKGVFSTRAEAEETMARLRQEAENHPDRVALADWARQRSAAQEKNFTGGHFDTPNVLVHALHSDRVTPDGANVRFLDEVQSDWHQKGKAKGYFNPNATKQFEVFDPKTGKNIQSFDSAEEAGAFISKWEADNPGQFLDYSTPEIAAIDGRVPDAPFKADSAWGGLMLKQQLQDAAEKGLDGVAWNVGATINDRYKLSRLADKIEYSPTTKILSAHDRQGNIILGHAGVSPEQLGDYIGKDVAKRLLATPHTTRMSSNGVPLDLYTLEGETMDLGSKAMTQFYDGVLPAEAERLLKPFGGGVERSAVIKEPARFPADEFVLGPTTRETFDPNYPGIEEAISQYPISQFTRDGRFTGQRYASQEIAEEKLKGITSPSTVDAWLARLTPEMRQQIIEKGFPLMALMMALQQQGQSGAGPQQNALMGALGAK